MIEPHISHLAIDIHTTVWIPTRILDSNISRRESFCDSLFGVPFQASGCYAASKPTWPQPVWDFQLNLVPQVDYPFANQKCIQTSLKNNFGGSCALWRLPQMSWIPICETADKKHMTHISSSWFPLVDLGAVTALWMKANQRRCPDPEAMYEDRRGPSSHVMIAVHNGRNAHWMDRRRISVTFRSLHHYEAKWSSWLQCRLLPYSREQGRYIRVKAALPSMFGGTFQEGVSGVWCYPGWQRRPQRQQEPHQRYWCPAGCCGTHVLQAGFVWNIFCFSWNISFTVSPHKHLKVSKKRQKEPGKTPTI